ncbi:hypothetical protein Tsubulata_008229 [Turnera subulata]|uniref:AUGMIN subunit 8 n=1 Tax=Turnera subulata TaxID=218843 RepID=A0A9Q0JM83_9ROSI|nr:hypothetical protein Tsubulata_008229 [Turnera subulata]
MDVCESKKHRVVGSPRHPLVPAERNSNNAAAAAAATATRRPATREVSSRYKSPTRASTPSSPRRCPSPSITRTSPATPKAAAAGTPKRSQSAERKRPSTPPSPRAPSTPVTESNVDVHLPSRRLSTGSRLQETLWPSTMRSLSVSFQSDSISVPVSKKEKPASPVASDRTLRPSSNVGHRQAEAPAGMRKPTPERKRSPLKGKNAQDQSENAKPVDSSHSRLIDQHRWPSRIGGKVSSNSLNKSADLTDKTVRGLSTPVGIGLSSLRRIPLSDSTSLKPLQKSSSDAAVRLISPEDMYRARDEANSVGSDAKSVDGNSPKVSAAKSVDDNSPKVSAAKSVDDNSPKVSAAQKLGFPDRISLPAIRTHPLPTAGMRPSSPSRASISRGLSPTRSRPATPARGVSPSPRVSASPRVSPSPRGVSPSPRGGSPSRVRASTVSSQMNSPASVLSFITDFKKGKKGANYVEDAHQLRLLHNRYLQWRFANARAEAVLYIQKVTAEKTLYNVLDSMLTLRDSVVRKRINLQQLQMELKLNDILTNQMTYLDDWALLEREHVNSLSGAVEDLEACTLRLPVTGGSKADLEALKVAISSAVDVMQAMGSSICCLLSKMEGMNILVSKLAALAEREKAMLDQCEAMLASTATMQVRNKRSLGNPQSIRGIVLLKISGKYKIIVEEYSIRTHLIQMKKAMERQPILAMKTPTWHDQLLI